MRLYWYGLQMLLKKFLLRQNTGKVICDFSAKMGVVYIKVAQILAMQNIGAVFTEDDRQKLVQICDHCNPIPFHKIREILRQEYGENPQNKFQSIDPTPLGSASISQVHRAILKDGTEVAIKIKRQDLTCRIARDVKQIRRLIHRFGKLVSFRNLFGSDRALECYLDWIHQETDFENEQRNIVRYQEFANSVNGKISDIKTKIVVPKLYPDYCTQNVIVMEFVAAPTINQLDMTESNKTKIAKAKNDYIRLSFYAMFHQMPVVFHGDPHGGNIYLTSSGDLGFLDMGLIFEFSPAEADLTRQLFLSAYTGKVDKVIEMLQQQGEYRDLDWSQLRSEMLAEIKKLKTIPVEQFFVEMIGIFTQYDIAVPSFLFKMAKAFLALFGMNTITNNLADTKSLLAEQVAEYYIRRSCNDVKHTFITGLQLAPKFLKSSLQGGLAQGISSQLTELNNFSKQCQTTLLNCQETLELLNLREPAK